MKGAWGFVAMALALAALGGCAKSEQQSGSGGRPVVALIMKSLANEFFSTMRDGAEKHAAEHADQYELVVNGIKDELDLNRQFGLVEEMVARGVQAIVIAPADSKGLVPACQKALEAGIVVVNIDNKLDDAVLHAADVKIPFVGPDNRKGARMVGEYLATKLKPGDPVAILEGVRTSFNGQQRRLGFEDAMNAAGMKIVDSQSGQWEMSKANQVASAMLSEHPEIKALCCSNDSMALGAMASVKTAGRAGKTLLVGFDNISAVQEAIRAGKILATADQHADQLAVFGIEYALQILDGQAPEDKETPVDLVTAETLAGGATKAP